MVACRRLTDEASTRKPNNGVEALQALEHTGNELPDWADLILILLGVNGRAMSELSFLGPYQQHPLVQKRQLLVVMLTILEHSRDSEFSRARPLAANCLTKPLTREKVENHFAASFSITPTPSV
jgi:hypothetical protein